MARGLQAPANLPELVREAFAEACAAGDVHYFATRVALVPVGSMQVRRRAAGPVLVVAAVSRGLLPLPEPAGAR